MFYDDNSNDKYSAASISPRNKQMNRHKQFFCPWPVNKSLESNGVHSHGVLALRIFYKRNNKMSYSGIPALVYFIVTLISNSFPLLTLLPNFLPFHGKQLMRHQSGVVALQSTHCQWRDPIPKLRPPSSNFVDMLAYDKCFTIVRHQTNLTVPKRTIVEAF